MIPFKSITIDSDEFLWTNVQTYALQSKYYEGIERKLALQKENKIAVKRFVTNSKEESSTQVRPLKTDYSKQSILRSTGS